MSPRRAGRFIVLEGIDGAGTTTQAERLSSALRAQGHYVHVTREPTDGPVGLLIRQALGKKLPRAFSAEALALLFAADRVDHVDHEILPALEAGKTVISDRYLLSSLAYQGMSLPMEWVEKINSKAITPDLTLFLEVDARTGAQRRSRRGGEAEIFDADALQRKIARQYLKAITLRARKERIVRLDGTLGVEEVTSNALAVIASRRWQRVARRR
jgi:dTMP kinase